MKKMMLMCAALLALTASSQAVKLGADTQALDLSGGIEFESAAGVNYHLRTGYGYFILDYLEVGGLLDLQRNDFGTSIGLGPKVEYNFELDLPVVVPFVGAALTFQHVEMPTATYSVSADNQVVRTTETDTTNALNLDVYGGLKFFITDQFAINADLVLSAATSDIYLRRDEAGKTQVRLELGLRYYF
jgi:hypothetical protein